VAERADRRRGEVGDIDLLDRLDEEGRLGEDLHVDQPRRRLERDGLELLAAMHPQWREDVGDGDREQPSVRNHAKPPRQTAQQGTVPAADDMVAAVNGFEQRIEMTGRPGSACGCQQHDRLVTVGKTLFQRLVPAMNIRPHDDRRRFPSPLTQEFEQARGDCLRAGWIFHREDNDTNIRLG
jgi:hypothetical protein